MFATRIGKEVHIVRSVPRPPVPQPEREPVKVPA
jgi:hypothetical protein